jgi:hypothetical protein
MMRAHVITDGKVSNTIVVDSLDFMPGLVEATAGGIGWDYVDGEFVDNRPVPVEEAPPAATTKEQLMAELTALTAKIQALT